MDESLTGDRLALTMYFLRKAKEMRGRVLVFIDGVHERRSGTSIRDTNQSTGDTCRTP